MKAVSDEIDNKPLHPDTILKSRRRERRCRQRNWRPSPQNNGTRRIGMWRKAPAIRSRLVGPRSRRVNFLLKWNCTPSLPKRPPRASSALDQHRKPLANWYRPRHQSLVEELCQLLVGDACRMNQRVMDSFNEASANNVQLPPMTWLPELEPEHVHFMVAKLRENCAL